MKLTFCRSFWALNPGKLYSIAGPTAYIKYGAWSVSGSRGRTLNQVQGAVHSEIGDIRIIFKV